MPQTLEVSRFPNEQLLAPMEGREGEPINLGSIVHMMRGSIDYWATMGLIKPNDSFGFAMAEPNGDWHEVWDDPYALTWLVGGWGPDRDRYVANAVRKMRAAARAGVNDTLEMRLEPSSDLVESFRDVVASVEPDGTFLWGDFPWGGAVYQDYGPLNLLGAVSALSEEEDHAVASGILGLIAVQILRLRPVD